MQPRVLDQPQDQVTSDLPVVDEARPISPRDELRYQGMTPVDIARDLRDAGKIGTLPNGLFDGDSTFLENQKIMFGFPDMPPIQQLDTNTIASYASQGNSRIQAFLDGQANIKGQDIKGTGTDAIQASQDEYARRMAPLEARKKEILTEMFGPANADTLVTIKEVNKGQAMVALGAALGALVRGGDVTEAINMAAAPLREAIARREEVKKLRAQQLGMEYKDLTDQQNFEQQRELQQEHDINTTDKVIQADEARAKRAEQLTKDQNERDARKSLDSIAQLDPEKHDVAFALTAWENAHGKDADPETWKLAKALSERYGRGAEADVAMKTARASVYKDNAKFLETTFSDRVKQVTANLKGTEWSNVVKGLQVKVLNKNLEYLDREKAVDLQGKRVHIEVMRNAIEMAKQGNARGWIALGIDVNKASDQEKQNALKAAESNYKNELDRLDLLNHVLAGIAADSDAANPSADQLERDKQLYEKILNMSPPTVPNP